MLSCTKLSRTFTLCDVLFNLNLLTLTVDVFFIDFNLAEQRHLCILNMHELMEKNNSTSN